MPYASDAQRKWAHTKTGMKKLGAARVHEYDEASRGKDLPERVSPRPRRYRRPEQEKGYFAKILGR